MRLSILPLWIVSLWTAPQSDAFFVHRPHSRLPTVCAASSTQTTQQQQQQLLLDCKRDFEEIQELQQQNLQTVESLDHLQRQIAELEREASQPAFWDNAQRSSVVNGMLSEKTQLLSRLQQWQAWQGDAQAALDILTDDDDSLLEAAERDPLLTELQQTLQLWQRDCHAAQLEWLLAGPYDHCDARLLLTAGAGGTEATDWVQDLTRLYTRYGRKRFDQVTILDSVSVDQGYKSVELLITGKQAYGWLCCERGSHRMVRQSPFNKEKKRQTTFCAVDVAPNVVESEIMDHNRLDIPDSDLEFATMRSSGKGGQNANKVESAVRLTHLPSGLSVKCDQERSQAQNKKIALSRLQAQLLSILQRERLEHLRELRGDVIQASFGNSIRNYVFDPYQLVKDPRTGWETSNIQSYMDGDMQLLDDCIGTYLRSKAAEQQQDRDDQQH